MQSIIKFSYFHSPSLFSVRQVRLNLPLVMKNRRKSHIDNPLKCCKLGTESTPPFQRFGGNKKIAFNNYEAHKHDRWVIVLSAVVPPDLTIQLPTKT